MAPKKKAQKIPLNEFLGDSALGSWADEMEALPSAPAMRLDDGRHDHYSKKDEFLASRPDRNNVSPREDLPLPTQPPYTAFVGNLSFDLTETELGEFFGSAKTKTIKIIRDRDDKPKGFGYVEFTDLEGLKDALDKSGSSFSGRTIRISVAEPAKERAGFASGLDDDAKFDNPWRRDRPLPDLPDPRDRRRFEAPLASDRPSQADGAIDWRSSRLARPAEPEGPPIKRKSLFTTENQPSVADKEHTWTVGSKFKPAPPLSSDDGFVTRMGSLRGRGEMGPPKDPTSITDDTDWRRSRPVPRNNTSPANSTPPTPQLNRRKLELLPRSASTSATSSPLSSPKISASTAVSSSRSNPFAGAKPVDVTHREKEVADRIEKERETLKDRPHPISRTTSHTASDRGLTSRTRTPPLATSTPSTPTLPKPPAILPPSSNVRPSLSFANAASAKRDSAPRPDEHETSVCVNDDVADVAT